VPLAPGPCGDWRGSLRIELSGADWRPRGAYPTACKVQTWPLAAADPQAFGERLMADLWRAVGGRLEGRVRSLQRAGSVSDPPPRQATASDAAGSDTGPRWVWRSPPLAQVVRDINKFSNNVMAQQLFLTLGALPDAEDAPEAGSAAEPRALRSGVAAAPPWPRPATPQAARDAMRRWAAQRLGEPAAGEFVIDNGSGLSRETRVTAQWLARLLQHAWASPVMPEFLASLPIAGVDGTMRRSRASPGRAHLKTGSLRDVIARAGYVLDDRGQRHVFVAIIQHPNAQAARPVLDALVDWTMRAEGGDTASKSTKTAPATKAAQTTPTAREKQARRTPTESGSRAPR
jgi:D-alanyl-D-alanine carboxypeptidase/D-alanyl-D-alanine-endopeptidase (penicillin-binding protein 4)